MMESASQLVFVDLEVAGGQITQPIIQVAAIAVDGDLRTLETFEAKLTFEERLADADSLTKHRYCRATWAAEARSATAVARDFASFLRRHAALRSGKQGKRSHAVAQLVAHHAPFDGPFLQAWFERVGVYFPGHYRMLCTLQRALWLFHEYPNLRQPRDYKLGTLCAYFGVRLPSEQAHTALADVRATVELYRQMTLVAAAGRVNHNARQALDGGQPRRVSRVAASGDQACRSRRKTGPKTCRLRRRRFLVGQP